ncbi:uncharacterized protein TRIADDRAFT_18356 [Trichoplax adhaerens]|uniref:AAA+ ATPase domain-containing protein n=1 Tax=Trichoplax adhaerens TaxID=10228 RepID=B3RI91_TRIAD|nr:hypothetical protein TRIADDRAFT_18356 [Trichoplax adhaerens]EDV29711.1 hypothetical protein TRIADDRAFT_18356 [Trichoplax adhaerens]|eukprot:XP_002108913.1 hypothetical protein TRIADDRAFT_18356 [Trichoplax adhaerens]
MKPNLASNFGNEAQPADISISSKRLRSSYIKGTSAENLSDTLKDPIEIVQLIRKNPNLGFLYLAPAVDRSSIEYNPYNLKVVTHSGINANDYHTISHKGVTHIREREETEFTELDCWEKDYIHYKQLIKIKTFSSFRLWKAFAVWRMNVRKRKINNCRNKLGTNLFILNSIAESLRQFHQLTKEVVKDACCTALEEAGFSIDEYYDMDKEQSISLNSPSFAGQTGFDIDPYGDAPEKMTYTEQANKRAHCRRLTSFIRLADYLVINTMHLLCVRSISKLLHALKEQLQRTPTMEEIQHLHNANVQEKKLSNSKTIIGQHDQSENESFSTPLFQVELLLDPNFLFFNPSLDDYHEGMGDLIRNFEDTVLSVPNLVSDEYFDPFTRPLINGKLEEKTCGEGPNLSTIFEDDRHLQGLIVNVKDTMSEAFHYTTLYSNTFESYRDFYRENEGLNLEHMRTVDHDVDFFAISLAKYHREQKEAESITEKQPVGMMLVDASQLKTKLLPSPRKCLEVVHDILPVLAKSRVDRLISVAQDAQYRLELAPSTTAEFVESLTFLEQIQVSIDSNEKESETIKELYNLIDSYQVPTPPEDFAVYQTLAPSITAVRNAIDKAVSDRDANLEKFCDHLDKDISELRLEVNQIKSKAQDPMILDPLSDVEKVNVFLIELHDRMEALQKRAYQYRTYQKNFKVEVTKFTDLEETHAELRLKQMLWDSLHEWEQMTREWKVADFKELSPEIITNQVGKYTKRVHQLEKGLPRNNAVPLLKEKVDQIRFKLPVITNLHNPSLKPRHWDMIESTLNYRFTSENPLSLGLLDEIGAFDHTDEIIEISSQASSEASLETLLKKVEDGWKATEFIVLPYRDSKDVFILGGTDDIQGILDDSLVNINLIASSRHVGPIKIRVDDWVKQLTLFNQTLDEWLICQKSWLYLESIFSAPDIQRQLPAEAKMFMAVDKSWKEIMRKTSRLPNALRACTQPGLLETFQNNNSMLDQIQKCLEAYLESKRVVFPRFYFLSNDELLEILAQTKNPHAVQPHLRKCFDGIFELEFGTIQNIHQESIPSHDRGVSPTGTKVETKTNDIINMISPENESISLGRGLKARGNVEDWLGKVEEHMVTSLRRVMKSAIAEYTQQDRNEWIMSYPSQVVLAVSQIMWCRDISLAFNDEEAHEVLKKYEQSCYQSLNNLAILVRGELTALSRRILCALITIDVHARDIVSDLVNSGIVEETNFEWVKQLRYYWDIDIDNCVVRMANSKYVYGYEYLGASSRLVITPLTDRCYLCLMGALQLDLGGSPAGPAGTGKTETTKDLAKSLAKQCVVFNCSEGLDYKMMGRFFSGLAQSGAWCCFDEFNRIDIEVLSVIAQQLLTIRNAKISKLARFIFEGREIKLNLTCATFITMNPGYAGRTELPENLKTLFRPFAMMVPDYALIAEVILYSEGFESSKSLARKMIQMYKLCSEQLSQQDHYDFGLRAVKSVLVMAGSLKRSNPDVKEDIVLIRALRDSNLPKFLAQDAVLFQAILSDLFPGSTIPQHNYGPLQEAIESILKENELQVHSHSVKKIIQFYETITVRHGVMLVGPTGGGKTTCYKTLGSALGKLYNDGLTNDYYLPVNLHVLNPKSVTMGELYGEIDKVTLEWRDGILATTVRHAVQDDTKESHWIICDGPVDALWIENMNTVLDDNKMLCLANSERIKLTDSIRMLFEVQDLAMASPATVSRCGMVYIDAQGLGWRPYVLTWLEKVPKLREETKEYILDLFNQFVEPGLKFVAKHCIETIPQVAISKICTLCSLLESLLQTDGLDLSVEPHKIHPLICTVFVFCYMWSIGGNLLEEYLDKFDSFARDLFSETNDVKLPSSGDLYGYYVDFELTRRLDSWERIIPPFKFKPEDTFSDVLVPTLDTMRYGYLFRKLITVNNSVLFTGSAGVGKSVIAKHFLQIMCEKENYVSVFLNFSAQTSSKRIQETIESKLERKRKTILSAPAGKHMILFVDDLNMPKLDRYGSQPPIELLRQYQDFGGFYDRDKLFWKELKEVTICGACGPPGGGRNPVTPRFLRHFTILAVPQPADFTLKHIFKSVLRGFLSEFPVPVKSCADAIVDAGADLYQRMRTEFLPTPAKSHYIFNLRDLSKCMQGILQANSGNIREKDQIMRMFFHEAHRVFHDRLIDISDKQHFYSVLSEISQKHFSHDLKAETFEKDILLFGDFLNTAAEPEDRIYEELNDLKKVESVLSDYLDEYNLNSSKEMKLVFFVDAIQHLSRIVRIARQSQGNALLVGVGGTGKQSLTRLACWICGYSCFQIELTRGYSYDSFHEDIRKLFTIAGVQGEKTVFLFTDSQIITEEFLEDINNILNSGEVPNLYNMEEYEKVIAAMRPICKDAGINEGDRDSIYQYFINRVKSNLHIVLCMSPVGEAFRSRTRMFPSLVNCCTIDWFTEWPGEALLSVAASFLGGTAIGNDGLKKNLATMCVNVHSQVSEISNRYYEELRRHYYTTPTSYLELINSYLSMLEKKSKQLTNARKRVKNGLSKLLETNELVAKMESELTALEPELKQKSEHTEKLMEQLQEDQKKADTVRRVVLEDEAIAKQKAEHTSAIKEDAQRDLDEALPALEAAKEALKALDKSDIAEIRVFQSPPEMVLTVMEAVCVLLQVKPDWISAKQILNDAGFLKRLIDFDKNNIPEVVLKKLKKYVENPRFIPEVVERTSKACKSMCMWVRACDLYAKVYREVEPKRIRLAAAEAELDETNKALAEKQARLAEVENEIAFLHAKYEQSVNEKDKLTKNIAQTAARLKRASKLTSALADEQIRWKENIKIYNNELSNVTGNVFVSAACVAYFGAFVHSYREELMLKWIEQCKDLNIPISENYSLINVMADPFEIRQWNADGLPRDLTSIENAILVAHTKRWPLMIDPQDQASRWIKNKELKNGLKIIKQTDSNFLRTLENCMRIGKPVLLEEVEETLDPSLEPILLQQIFVQQGRSLIRIGDSDIEYDKNFRLYITTKLANPHYLPDVCIKVTIINFTVNKSGLEDQLLSDVVRLEKPELEDQRNQLIVRINTDKNQLKVIEERILKLLFNSEGNILDDEDLINTLNESKVTSSVISTRLKEAEQTEAKISVAREKYRSVATRGSVLYFVVASLAEIDPMYQYSLKYFKQLFNKCIEKSEKADDLGQRLNTLVTNCTQTIYVNVSRGLFERHKVVASFMVCCDILKQRGEIDDGEWNYFLRGNSSMNRQRGKKPDVSWITPETWAACCNLQENLPAFKNLCSDITKTSVSITLGRTKLDLNPAEWEGYHPLPSMPATSSLGTFEDDDNEQDKVRGHWNVRLTNFQKLIMIKEFKEEEMIFAIFDFIIMNLGKEFVESPSTDLSILYQDMNQYTPLIFILSTGSDPMSGFQRFAKDQGFMSKVQSISLGQGQGPIAEKMILSAMRSGNWVFLQNCHLAESWMPSLENIIKTFTLPDTHIHEEFRFFLSSMPTKAFPVTILQNSIKVTNELPKGLRSNLRRSFAEIDPVSFNEHLLGTVWRKLVFGLCFFHAVILERKKFGPLGWNIRYQFNDSDRECALENLKIFIDEGHQQIAWPALTFIIGEITYGGRVTDNFDQRCLRTLLKRFFSPLILDANHTLSSSGIYYAPECKDLTLYRDYIEQLPFTDEPEVFGMHNNANISYQIQEGNHLIRTVLDVQPRIMTSASGQTSDEIILELADNILKKLPDKLDITQGEKSLFELDDLGRSNSLTVVLSQEFDRFHNLVNVIKTSLDSLTKAIMGVVVMSEELEKVYGSFLNNQIPELWATAAYPSLKPLGSWIKDLILRIQFINTWISNGNPKAFWISGFFFPQGFLTGVLQNYARKYNYPIDQLSFHFSVYPQYINQGETSKTDFTSTSQDTIDIEVPENGVLIHGLFMDACRWNDDSMMVSDSLPGEITSILPVLHLEPRKECIPDDNCSKFPLYKTSARAGVLSTTGHSTNFVVMVSLPTDLDDDHWIARGSALLCQLND